jgi:hypothetical protein
MQKAEPIDVFVPAFSSVLREGLPVIGNTDGDESFGVVVAFTPTGATVWWNDWQESCEEEVKDLNLNLRDPAVRDAVVRALWHKLHPNQPEPPTAPRWFSFDGCDGPAWALARERWVLDRGDIYDPETDLSADEVAWVFVGDEDGGDDGVFAWGREDTNPRYVEGLTGIGTSAPDRNLLALAEVAKVVLA